jgi:hypothetical protein
MALTERRRPLTPQSAWVRPRWLSASTGRDPDPREAAAPRPVVPGVDRLRDPMHAIKHLAVRRKDDGSGEVRVNNPSRVIDDRADCDRTASESTVLINLSDVGDQHFLGWQALRPCGALKAGNSV